MTFCSIMADVAGGYSMATACDAKWLAHEVLRGLLLP